MGSHQAFVLKVGSLNILWGKLGLDGQFSSLSVALISAIDSITATQVLGKQGSRQHS